MMASVLFPEREGVRLKLAWKEWQCRRLNGPCTVFVARELTPINREIGGLCGLVSILLVVGLRPGRFDVTMGCSSRRESTTERFSKRRRSYASCDIMYTVSLGCWLYKARLTSRAVKPRAVRIALGLISGRPCVWRPAVRNIRARGRGDHAVVEGATTADVPSRGASERIVCAHGTL